MWFTGLTEVAKRYQLAGVYDLSATPYYLNGSGYTAYSLFPWVVSDFGLTEAIESGLVKIPFMPESDDTQQLSEPVLRDLYRHVKESLPKKGQTAQKKEAKKEGRTSFRETRPQLHQTLVAAMDQFYGHYADDFQRTNGLFGNPPVFIAVCNNTTVSKEIYKHIAGFDYEDEKNERRVVSGHFPLFNNFDEYGRPLNRPPTLLIDSAALEDGGQVDDEFKRVFAPEIEKFKREYAHFHGQGSAEQVTDAEILREVVNTVGKPNALGSHIRCVVSVSMLTEGWDANTVTHIMGLRAFGSQLLCEQVAGRALRRKNYELLPYDARTNEAVDPKLWKRFNPENLVWKFPPEYAQIIGVPFKTFKKGDSTTVEPPEYTRIDALPARQDAFEITFPNVVGYRVETGDEALRADFSEIENFELDFTSLPVKTVMGTAFSAQTEHLEFDSLFDLRDQTVVYRITQHLINFHHADLNNNPQFARFHQLRQIVQTWYDTKVRLVHQTDPAYKRILYFWDMKTVADHIQRGIMAATRGTDRILPVLHHYNRFGSTRYVHGTTSKPVFPTIKSHVNYVVADTDSWEQIAAKTLEELPEVFSYAKNAFLGFTVPYVNNGKESLYYPDFLVRIRTASGQTANLILEITGMNREKEAKRWYMQNRWLPAINGVLDELDTDPWFFAEVANDIRFVRNQLKDEIGQIGQTLERIARLKASFGTIKNAPPLTSEQLRREILYED